MVATEIEAKAATGGDIGNRPEVYKPK